jgi:hypothetical protein
MFTQLSGEQRQLRHRTDSLVRQLLARHIIEVPQYICEHLRNKVRSAVLYLLGQN